MLNPTTLVSIAGGVTGLIAIRTTYRVIKAYWRARMFRQLNPDMKVIPALFGPSSLLVLLGIIPPWMIKFSHDWQFRMKYKVFEGTVADTFAIATPDHVYVHVANPELTHQMMQARYKEFLKPIHHYGVLDVFGRNIVSTESDDWRRHRKISAPQFSERNNALVHDEAVRTARMMFEAWEEEAVNNGKDLSSQGFEIDASKDMMRFALTVISSALFGMQLQWGLENETKNKPAGHTLSFQQSLETMLHNLVLWLMFPKPMFYLPIPVLTETRIAFQEFSAYLKELLDSARTNRSSDANLINMLVQAADDEGEKAGLSETELTGNAFAFILAGHETTAGALQYALSVLAEQPELQEKLYNHVKEVVGDEDAPTFKDFSSLTYVQAMMQETLRMYPIVTTIPKWTADASLNLGPWVLPPKTYVNVVTTGLHFHPEVWEEPLKFNPDRFLGNYNRNAWVPFSEGPRGCLGKKFSQVEFVCALSTIVLRYRFTPALGADPEAYKEPFSIITLKPKNPVKLTFYKR